MAWTGKKVQDVALQDQTSPILAVPFNKLENTTILTAPTAISNGPGAVIAVDDATGFAAGKFVSVANIVANRYYTAEVVSVASKNITLDTPLDYAFPVVGTVVSQGTHDLKVNGSVTTQVFSLRATDPGLAVVIDITKIRFVMTTTSPVDLSKFGNFAALTSGMVLRRTDGFTQNIFNVKSNSDIDNIMDWEPYEALNPAQGVDGFVAELQFSGQGEVGVAVRVGVGEDLELLIQDDLVTAQGGETISTFKCMIIGHIVVP